MCGATLLNKRYAMTAMHCVTDATNLVVSEMRNRFISYLEMQVALGEHNIRQDIESQKVQVLYPVCRLDPKVSCVLGYPS